MVTVHTENGPPIANDKGCQTERKTYEVNPKEYEEFLEYKKFK
jgi:hypothetical protein